MGPLTEVATQSQLTLPEGSMPGRLTYSGIRLAGYEIDPVADVDDASAAVTLYWHSDQPVLQPLHVHLRWLGEGLAIDKGITGQHPVNNYYPTNAWRTGEIVTDFHLLKRPVNRVDSPVQLQVALSPPFVVPEEEAWGTVAELLLPDSADLDQGIPVRVQLGAAFLDLVDYPEQVRPLSILSITYRGYGGSETVSFQLREIDAGLAQSGPGVDTLEMPRQLPSFTGQFQLDTDLPPARYQLVAKTDQGAAICGWLSSARSSCPIGVVTISGVPLPAGAVDFDDRFALLSVEIPDPVPRPGGRLNLTLHWQSLAEVDEEYTVFVQLLDERDTIMGQTDAWPVQGTYPTSQWKLGEKIVDRHEVQLADELPPGSYRLQVGFYLLATLRRLPVLGPEGLPVDDKAIVATLTVDSAD